MMNKMFKKGVALLGGVMMLLNMALPGFTYAEEPTAPFTVTMSASEVVDNKVTVEVKYPAIDDTLIASNKWIDAEITVDQDIPENTEVTTTYTLGTAPQPAVTTKIKGKAFYGSTLMKQSAKTPLNNTHKNATEKFEITFNIPGKATEQKFNVTVKSVLYDAENATNGTELGKTTFAVTVPADSDLAKKAKVEKVEAAVLKVTKPNPMELKVGEDNVVHYEKGDRALVGLKWENLDGVSMVKCSLKGKDKSFYGREGNKLGAEPTDCTLIGDTYSIKSDELVSNNPYTLTIDFGDDVTKAYTLKFERATVKLTLKDGKQDIKHDVVAYKGEVLPKLNDPTKPRYRFVGWTTDEEGKTKYDLAAVVNADLTLYAQWRRTSGGGGSSSSSSATTATGTQAQSGAQLSGVVAQTGTQLSGVVATGTNESKVVKTLESLRSGAVDQAASTPEKAKQLEALKASLQSESNTELRDAYTYAYLRGMTTQPTIQQADLHRGLTRAEMAKMMSVFAVKVLGKSPVLTGTVDYKDLNQVNGDLPGYIQQAYQLQIMGIDAKGNPIANFNPNAQVTRAEFATVLSRVLYGDKNNQEGANFAEKHLEALKAAGILKDTTPTMKELRGWVMLMLMRAEGVK